MTETRTFSETATAIIIVDHGSRRAESNQTLLQATERFASSSGYRIVEPAHMELAEPSISTAFDRCIQRGAKRVIVFPYFLSPGRHWSEDIPALVAKSAEKHPGVEWLVTAPFGLHSDMNRIIDDRIEQCLQNASSKSIDEAASGCDVCEGTVGCQFHTT